MIKTTIQYLLGLWGKRIVSLDSPAKSFEYGVSHLRKRMPGAVTIIDVGAADGTGSLLKNFTPDVYQYVLIEANPRFNDYLDSFKKMYPSTVVEKCFCGESESVIPFNINDSGRSSRYVESRTTEKVQVPMKTLDGIVSEHVTKGPYLIKIDVEGAEMDVLHGAREVLCQTDVVIVETWINPRMRDETRDFAALVSFMHDHEFVLHDFFGGSIYKNGILKQVDAVFIKKGSVLQEIP